MTSCDAPFLNLSLISHLLSQIQDWDVVVPFLAGALSTFARCLPDVASRRFSHGQARAQRVTAHFALPRKFALGKSMRAKSASSIPRA